MRTSRRNEYGKGVFPSSVLECGDGDLKALKPQNYVDKALKSVGKQKKTGVSIDKRAVLLYNILDVRVQSFRFGSLDSPTPPSSKRSALTLGTGRAAS
jgi:hypothetical protein